MQTQTDSEAFARGMAMLCLNFNRELTDQLIELYWLVLSDMPIESFKVAVKRSLRESKVMPRAAELLELAGLSESVESRAIAAWNDVLAAVPRGAYKHIDFQDKCINASIRSLGGWPNFLGRFTDAESEKWARNDFIKAYNALSRGVSAEACEPLAGLGECSIVNGNRVPCIPVSIPCSHDRLTVPRIISKPSSLRIGERIAAEVGGRS